MSSLRSRVARGAAWMVFARVCDRGLGFVSTLILARLLAPDDFGIIAMAMSVVALLDILRAFGLDVALVQHAAPEPVHYNTAWTLNVAVSVAVSSMLAALAFPTAGFFGEPRLVPVMFCVALIPLISAVENIGVVDFRRNLQFDRDFRFMLVGRLAGFAVTVPLAFTLRNEWALVFGMLTGRLIQVGVSYWMHPFRPRFSLGAGRELYGFSKWLFVNNVIQLAAQRSVDFVVGRLAGPRALGLFSVSHEIAFLPSSELAAPINRAILPGYAQRASEPESLRRGFLDVIGMLAITVVPAAAGLMATGYLAVPVLLGDQWLEAIPLVPLLALYGMFNAFGSTLATLFLALGTPRVVTVLAGLRLFVLLPIMLVAVSRMGVVGAAWAYVAGSLATVPLAFAILMRRLDLPLRDLVSRVWRPIVAVACMVSLLRWLAAGLPEDGTTLAMLGQLLLLVGSGAATYAVAELGLWWLGGRPDGAERFLLDFAASALRTLRGREE